MNEERLLQVLLGPLVSEKSTNAADSNRQFTFRVLPDANKLEIRHAVEKLFDVKVVSVKVLNVNGKVKRFGQIAGRRNDWKKAYVKLAEGNDIQFAGGA
ncbi:MAG: 50S ribosomal protein L23 [gamma proteobacterium symbiont of Bathyaustriella thionipta]|nr:50S ribosomal protein L23 [gamma proteobacterium symbiont of Bathyaustriella thionipta]